VSLGPKMSFVASCRLNGTTLFFIERFATNFEDAAVVILEAGVRGFAKRTNAR
jgi:hypothetical protein